MKKLTNKKHDEMLNLFKLTMYKSDWKTLVICNKKFQFSKES